jgi:Tol biopolymer transport system component
MSPEQARGKPVDRRTDLWSLGCVLYECLTGRRLFAGETVSDSLAAILRKDPDWSALPDETPPLLKRLLRRLLARDPSRRAQDAGDVRLELEEIIADPRAAEPAAARPVVRERLAWVVAVLAVIASLALALVGRQPPSATELVRLTIPLETPAYRGALSHTVSPDGSAVVFFATDNTDHELRMWRRRLDSFEAEPIVGTEGGGHPFWSADGTSIGYFARGKLLTIDLEEGGAPHTVAALTGIRSATWNGQGDIVFAQNESPLMHVAASGGTPKPVTQLDPEFYEVSHDYPRFLPDGRHFLFLALTYDPEQEIRVRRLYAGSLDSAEANYLGTFSSNMFYVEPGFLFFVDDGTLKAVTFDVESLRVEGEPRVIEDGVRFFHPTGNGNFSVSRNGTVVFQRPRTANRLMWFDKEGRRLGPVGDVGDHDVFRISPDGSRVATTAWDPRTELTDIWIYGLRRDTSTRITFDPRWEGAPVWSADGSRLFYATDATGWPNVLVMSVDSPGEAESIFTAAGDQFPSDTSSDGQHLIVTGADPAHQAGTNIWIVSLPRREDEEPLLFAATPADENDARFSPDDDWIAYVSNESGAEQIYVKAFPGPGQKVQVSTEGGRKPVWGSTGRTLYYLQSTPCPFATCTMTRVMVVDLSSVGLIDSPQPRLLFETREEFVSFEVEPGGERLLVHVRPDERAPVHVVVGAGGG